MIHVAAAILFTLALVNALLYGASAGKLCRMLDAGMDEREAHQSSTFVVTALSLVAGLTCYIVGLLVLCL